MDESFPDGGDYAGYSVASFRRRFRLSDGVAYPFLENSRLYRTDRLMMSQRRIAGGLIEKEF